MSVIDASVDIEIAGEKHKLLFNVLALHHFRKITGKEILDLLLGILEGQNASVVETTALLWAGIHKHETNRISVSFEEFAASLLPEDIADERVQEALGEAIRRAMPMPKKTEETEETEIDESTQTESPRPEGGQNGQRVQLLNLDMIRRESDI